MFRFRKGELERRLNIEDRGEMGNGTGHGIYCPRCLRIAHIGIDKDTKQRYHVCVQCLSILVDYKAEEEAFLKFLQFLTKPKLNNRIRKYL